MSMTPANRLVSDGFGLHPTTTVNRIARKRAISSGKTMYSVACNVKDVVALAQSVRTHIDLVPRSAPPLCRHGRDARIDQVLCGYTLLGTQAINAQGVAALTLNLPLGPNAITAVYSGSAGFAASTSSALSVSARALSAITFSASPTTQLATMAVVFTAQVNSATTGVQTGQR